jgi:hypothetical protein
MVLLDHSVLIASVVGACFFLIFFTGAVALGRERTK